MSPSLCLQEVILNIDDKNPTDYPQGVVYKLKGELIIPQIDATDTATIFEEHRVVRNLSSFQHVAEVKSTHLFHLCS